MKYVLGAVLLNNQNKQYTIIEVIPVEMSYKYKFKILFESGYETVVTKQTLVSGRVSDLLSPSVHEVGILGYSKQLKPTIKEDKLWRSLIAKCYSEKHESYKYYGGKGIQVSTRWLRFDLFIEDLRAMSNYDKLTKGYHLDKDIKFNGTYSKDSCSIVPYRVNNVNTSRNIKFYILTPENIILEHTVMKYFAQEHNLDDSCILKCLKGTRKAHKGYKFSYNLSDLQ